MNLKIWLKSLYVNIQKSDNAPFVESIKDYKELIKVMTEDSEILWGFNEDLHKEVDMLNSQLISNDKHNTLISYRCWLKNNIVPKSRYYDFGHGRKQVHTIFADSLKDEELIRDFIVSDLEFDATVYDTADKLVYWFNRKLSQKYPTSKYYAYDTVLYGKREYWATAKETIALLRKGGKSFDCDDSMTLRYSCLYYLLEDYFPDDKDRLRGFIVDMWVGGGHALLAWIKEGPNDWIPIETTFLDDKEGVIWNGNYKIRDQLLYQIRYSFDNESEYERI